MSTLVNTAASNHGPRGSVVPLPTIVGYVRQIAQALQEAHNEKIIHRDIKPENLLLGHKEEIILSDFGIAAVAQSTASWYTQGIAGTPYYMAPEQFRGKPQPASDQYALAIVVYEWLCGKQPFIEGDFIQLGFQHTYISPPSLHEAIQAIPPKVEEVVLKALAKNPDERFPSVTEFAKALEGASALPGESYYPEHVALAMRECYYQWCDKADWGEMREITADEAKELQHKLQDRRRATMGYRRAFTNGAIYWSKRGGAQPIWGGFNQIHNNEGGVEGILGFPLEGYENTYQQEFEGGVICVVKDKE